MAHITEEHLHHMAKRHHATMQKLDTLTTRIRGLSEAAKGSLEMGAGAWLGGAIEGKTAGKSIGPVPLNLGIGAILLTLGHVAPGPIEGFSEDLVNVGNGFIASYLAATGYAFGKRWNETGKPFGGGGNPWLNPYENGWPKQGAQPPIMPPIVPPAPPAPPMPPMGPMGPPAAAGW